MAERTRHWRTISDVQVQFPSTGCKESELYREIFASVPDVSSNGCELHFKPHFNFNLLVGKRVALKLFLDVNVQSNRSKLTVLSV